MCLRNRQQDPPDPEEQRYGLKVFPRAQKDEDYKHVCKNVLGHESLFAPTVSQAVTGEEGIGRRWGKRWSMPLFGQFG
jgi:hypothetical protein